MVPDDLIQPFQIESHALRGRLIRLGPVIDTVLGRHDYPEPVAVMLGETLVLAAGLAAALKFDGVFILQAAGDGPISLMVADLTSGGEMRGYAKFDRDRLAEALATPGPGRPEGGPLGDSVARLIGAGRLALTVDQNRNGERYQGIVELDGATLAECIQHHLRQSDQLETGLRLAVGRVADAAGRSPWRGGALMLQRLPGNRHDAEAEEPDEAWRRALALMSAASDGELLDPGLAPDRLLYRLFHQDGIRVYRPRPLKMGCRCSDQRVGAMLRAMPRARMQALSVDGVLSVTCEFCSETYRFDPPALDAVLEGGRRRQA